MEKIKETIREIVREEINNFKFNELISSLKDDELNEQYIPYRLTHSFCWYGSYLFESESGNYAQPNEGYSVPLAKVKQELACKYALKDWQFTIHKQLGNVEVAIVIADIDDNAKMVERDMEQMGYFVGHRYQVTAKNGTKWLQMQFEPKYQKELEIIKRNHYLLIHISPIQNVESIRTNGFIPSSKNKFLSYPDRVYLYVGNDNVRELVQLLKGLYIANGWEDDRFCLFLIDSYKVPKNIKFYIDPNMENGIYTYDKIPYSSVFKEICVDLSNGRILSAKEVN